MTTRARRASAAIAATALLSTVAVSSAAAAPGGVPGRPADPGPPANPGGYTLTVLHVNDGESDLLADADTGGGSISQFGTLLDQRRDATSKGGRQGSIAITAGDNFLASPEFQASLDNGTPFYDSIALDHIDFDAYVIGNHEFDFGPNVLADFIEGFGDCSEDPFLSANLDFSAVDSLSALEAEGCIADSTVIKQDGRKIGIIGLTTPELREVSSPGDVVISAELAAIANAEAQRLTDAGVEIIIVASHLQAITNEVELAASLTNVDAIIGGGGGEELSQALTAVTADGVTIPIVTVPGDYFDVGELTLRFDRRGTLTGFDWMLNDVTADISSDPYLVENVEAPIEAYVASLAEQIIATSQVGLNGIRADVRSRETNTGNLLTDAYIRVAQTRAAEFGVSLDGPIVGLTNGGGIRNDSIIGPGEISVLDTFDIAPFTNFVSITEDVSPADLVALVEHGLSGLPGAAGSFGQWSGLVVEYAPAVLDAEGVVTTPASIVNLTVNGTPYVIAGVLQSGLAPVDVATINFLAGGQDGYDELAAYEFTTLGTTYQQALAGQIAIADLSTGSVEYRPRADVSLRTRIIPVG